jgi:DNA-binding XRE family transcriptional regulator
MTPPRKVGAKKALASSYFPQNLRALRGDRSQTEFAEWLLVSQQTLSFWEQGKRRPNRRTWVVLEQRLGFSQAQLESAALPVLGHSSVAEGSDLGHTITLPPLHGAVALRLGLKGLSAETMGMADIQRALREALRGKRPVWLVVG